MPVNRNEKNDYVSLFCCLADVTGGQSLINGSGIYFDQDKYYPHWYKNFFNKTIPLFGPYAWRADDFYGKNGL